RHRAARRRRAGGRRRRVAARRPDGLGGPDLPRRAEPGARCGARVNAMTQTQSAWATGLATFAGDRMLDAWFPDPQLGLEGAPTESGTREVQGAACGDLIAGAREDERRGVRVGVIATVIPALSEPPAGTADAYLRLHLLSHRLI